MFDGLAQVAWRPSWRLHGFFWILFAGVVSYHPSIQRSVIGQCTDLFERECQVKLSSSSAVFHALLGSVVFKNIQVKREGAHQPLLSAQHTSISFAPLQSALCKKFIFESSIAGMRFPIARGFDGLLDVVDFFKALLSSSSPYVSLRGLHLEDIAFGDVLADVNVAVPRTTPHELMDVSVVDGDLKFPMFMSAQHPARIGKSVLGIPGEFGTRKISGELYGRQDRSFLVFREGEHVRALFEYSGGKVLYRFVAPCDDLVGCAQALFPEKNIKDAYAPYRSVAHAQDLLIKCRGEYDIEGSAGRMQFASSHYRSSQVTAVAGVLTHSENTVSWNGNVTLRENFEVKCNVSGDVKKKSVKLSVTNNKVAQLPLGNLMIRPSGLRLTLKTGSFGNLLGRYDVLAGDADDAHRDQLHAKGIFSIHDEQISVAGNLNSKLLYLLASCQKGIRCKRFLLLDEKKNVEIQAKSLGVNDEICKGFFSQQCLYQLIPRFARTHLTGDPGRIVFKINQSEMPMKCVGEVSLLDSACCLVGSSNPLISASARFDVDAMLKAATISDIDFTFASGSAASKEILLNWSPEGISYFHVPLVLSNMLINRERDFYAILDGACSVDWIDGGKYRLDGSFMIKKSQLSSLEFLSQGNVSEDGAIVPYVESQKKDGDLGIDGNIMIKTQEPTVIDLPTLRTRAHLDVRLGGYFRSDGFVFPKISGSLRFDGGVLEVLGRPLRIMKGSVDILPNQVDNPIIDFFAYTNVKQYRITIHGSGSLQQPNLIFESNPPLSQEQIIGLMLSGSEYADINQQLPGLFLQNIHKMLNPAEQSEHGRSVLQPLLNSLRYIQLLPYQDDLSSQKTVKARLNIDLGPHLRALVHKDIFGKEAVAMLVEYDVSDEFNVRLMRQSSGVVGAEAEIRFKF